MHAKTSPIEDSELIGAQTTVDAPLGRCEFTLLSYDKIEAPFQYTKLGYGAFLACSGVGTFPFGAWHFIRAPEMAGSFGLKQSDTLITTF